MRARGEEFGGAASMKHIPYVCTSIMLHMMGLQREPAPINSHEKCSVVLGHDICLVRTACMHACMHACPAVSLGAFVLESTLHRASCSLRPGTMEASSDAAPPEKTPVVPQALGRASSLLLDCQ